MRWPRIQDFSSCQTSWTTFFFFFSFLFLFRKRRILWYFTYLGQIKTNFLRHARPHTYGPHNTQIEMAHVTRGEKSIPKDPQVLCQRPCTLAGRSTNYILIVAIQIIFIILKTDYGQDPKQHQNWSGVRTYLRYIHTHIHQPPIPRNKHK